MITFKSVTPRGPYKSWNAASIHLKTIEGELTILPNHMPLIAAIVPSALVVTLPDGTVKDYAVAEGFFRFADNDALILTDAIEGKGDIDIDRARKAYERARQRLEKKDSDTNMRRAELALARAINRIHVYGG